MRGGKRKKGGRVSRTEEGFVHNGSNTPSRLFPRGETIKGRGSTSRIDTPAEPTLE